MLVSLEAGFLNHACADACPPPPIIVSHAWIGGDFGSHHLRAVYGVITNYLPKPIKLTRIISSDLISAAAYYVKKNSRFDEMIPMSGIDIQPRSRTHLIQGGRYMMLINSNRPFKMGSELDLTFEFSDGNDVKIKARVNQI